MDRVAVFVDAGYLFATGSALISRHGKEKRHALGFDEQAAIKELTAFSLAISDRPLLRIYWYDATRSYRGPTRQHLRLAHCDHVKVRLGYLNDEGQQKGVDSLVVTDIVELARNRAMSDMVLLSGDEDVRIGVQLAQGFGVKVHLLGINPSRGTQSLQLLQEADTCSEWGSDTIRQIMTAQAVDLDDTLSAVGATLTLRPGAASVLNPDIQKVLDTVVREVLSSLGPSDVSHIVAHMSANKNNIPIEMDSTLLVRARAACERDILPAERRHIRSQFRGLVKKQAVVSSRMR